jgi:signal peptidase I
MTPDLRLHQDTETTAPVAKPVVSSYVPSQRASKRGTPRKDNWSSALSTIAVLMIAPIVALFLTAFVFQSYQVDGPSMETTLFNGDRLVVLKVPRTWSRITGNAYVPNRGDVIIFHESEMSSFGQGSNKQLIKRVIALPGERIVVKNNRATVYNKANPKGFQPDQALPYGSVINDTAGDIDKVVEKNHVFVLGDNRDNSLDSRAFGTVNTKDIVGKLILRVWPASDMKAF